MKNLDILVVEDERAQRQMLRDFLAKEGFRVAEAEDGQTALKLLKSQPYDVAILDYRMPGMSGQQVLEEAKRLDPRLDVILLTAFGTIDTAVQAMKAGAADYLSKPIDLEELLLAIDRLAERRTLIKENEILRQELKDRTGSHGGLVHRSAKMTELVNLAGRIASSRTTILIQGESGTGKELMAKMIHALSERSEHPLIPVNCAALPDGLVESELFGHEKGSFTGAVARRIGYFEQADGGTLFLDEIGELPPPVQVKLLRFLQDRQYQRVGASRSLTADVRVISATNADLAARVKEGAFREDLLFRLNVITMTLPPLRERREDITLLAEHFISRFAVQNRKRIDGVSREAMDLLVKYDYPGNVRELENIIERAVVISRSPMISTRDLPFADLQAATSATGGYLTGTLPEVLEAIERKMIRKTLENHAGNQSRAAEELGISERMLRYKIAKLGLRKPNRK